MSSLSLPCFFFFFSLCSSQCPTNDEGSDGAVFRAEVCVVTSFASVLVFIAYFFSRQSSLAVQFSFLSACRFLPMLSKRTCRHPLCFFSPGLGSAYVEVKSQNLHWYWACACQPPKVFFFLALSLFVFHYVPLHLDSSYSLSPFPVYLLLFHFLRVVPFQFCLSLGSDVSLISQPPPDKQPSTRPLSKQGLVVRFFYG